MSTKGITTGITKGITTGIMEGNTVWDKVKNFMIGSVINTISEINILIPDSILFGSLLLYFLTQNMAFGIFSIFIFETVISHKIISWTSAQTVGSSRSTLVECRPGFKTPQFSVERMFSHDTFPSYSVFSITAIGTYLMMATKEFSETMKSMGPEWSMRATAAYSFIALVLITFILSRRFSICGDSTSEILMAVAFAVFTGLIFFYVNKSIFGQEAMNFLGLPYIVSKDSEGTPIYVCAAEKDNKEN